MTYNYVICFFFNDTATTEIYTLSLHDALPISSRPPCPTCSPAGRRSSAPRPGDAGKRAGGRRGSLYRKGPPWRRALTALRAVSKCRSMTAPFKVKLPDGSVREVEPGTTPADVAAAIGPGLAKAALAARVNGELRDLNRPLEGDAELALITARDEAEALELVRHDYAHVLAEAVQNLFPGTQITFGPATEDGFYYDFAPAPEIGRAH